MPSIKCFFSGHKYTKVSDRELTWKFLVVITLCERCGDIQFKEWIACKERK
jgi:hypothetical protein